MYSQSRSRLVQFLFVLLLLVSRPAFAISDSERVSDERFRAEFHWAAAVINTQSGGVCGGVLIASRWVLTAAHCAGSPRYVLLDSALRSVAKRVEVTKRILHPDYDIATGQNDVALLHLAESVDIAPAALASSVDSLMLLRNGAAARVIGWGRSDRGSRPENRLRIAEPKLNNFKRLGNFYIYEGYAGPCGRDSGSPMLMQTIDGRWLVVGIARAAKNMCGGGKGAAVYTDVGKVEEFIRAHVGDDGLEAQSAIQAQPIPLQENVK